MRRTTTIAVLALLTSYSVLYTYGRIQLRRARQLVKAIEALKTGVVVSKQQLATNVPGLHCSTKNCNARLSNLPALDSFSKRLPRVMPSDWWFVGAQIGIDPDGRLDYKQLVIDDGKYYQFGTVEISVFQKNNCAPNSDVEMCRAYFPRREMRTGALLIHLASEAPPNLTHRAFDLNLACLNALQGCDSPGDIAPGPWQDVKTHGQTERSPLSNPVDDRNRETSRLSPYFFLQRED
jgi:hypothetical protein